MRPCRGFTLVELISTIAILAILIAITVPMIGNYVSSARAASDKHNLNILNDAVNRYKMGGGNLVALTAGKPYQNLLSALATPVGWNGLTHQFLREGTPLEQATTIAATGSGHNYRITAFNSYNEGGGSQAPLSPDPSFGGEIGRFLESANTHSSYAYTLPSAVAAGKRLVIAGHISTTHASLIQSATDSKGNSYAIDGEYHTGINELLWIVSSVITTPLEAGDTITITYSTSAYISEDGFVFVINQGSNDGPTFTGQSYGSTVSFTESVTNAPAICVGLLSTNGDGVYTPSVNWTRSGAIVGDVSLFYRPVSASGSITLNGTLNADDSFIVLWTYYY